MRIAAQLFCLWLFLLASGPSALSAEGNKDSEYYRRLLDRYLSGITDLEEELRAAPAAIPVLEEYLDPSAPAEVVDVSAFVRQLGADEFAVREAASQTLKKILPGSRDQLAAVLEKTDDPEVRMRLKRLLLLPKRDDVSALLPQLLKNMYARHFREIWPEYFTLLEKDPFNKRALSFINATDPEMAVQLIGGELDPKVRLRYFLALKYSGCRWNRLTERMQEFTGSEILAEASGTYWPIELQPLKQDGTYHWTVRCATLIGRRANDVMMMSIDSSEFQMHPPPAAETIGKKSPSGNMVHFDTWARWDYLFRFETPYVKTYHGVVLASYHNNHLSSKVVQTIPPEMKLATARVAYQQQQSWSLGKSYAWAKELYPSDLLPRLTFRQESGTTSSILSVVEPTEEVPDPGQM